MDPFVGEVRPFAFGFAPKGWALCEGQLLAIGEHTALYSLLGITYGGDGKTTFALPDLRGMLDRSSKPVPQKDPIGFVVVNYCIALTGIFPSRP